MAMKAIAVGMMALAGLTVEADVMTTPALKDVRLEGPLAEKANTFFHRRIVDPVGRENIFEEARRAFVLRDDDERPWDGQWRGEFWGKSMISAARVADYRNDPALKAWIASECKWLASTADADGYVGSYSDKTLCSTPPDVVKKHNGGCTNWNLWNRKYAIWGQFMAYQVTGDRTILAAATRQLDQLIAMLREKGIKLADTGHYTLNGMPTMSILKPLLMIYAETKKPDYLAFAEEIVRGWDREDNRAPNFFRNASKDRALYAWYPKPPDWAKTYEMLSCLDGLVEYHRVTGDRRSLETVKAIRDNLDAHESNQIGGLGISDRLLGAERFTFCSTEVCDVIHWIRLNVDLYLATGDDRYLDSVEFSYFNAFLASVYRGSGWTPLLVRDFGRHRYSMGQCGYAYNHCCVDNAARTFLDVASVAVTKDAQGAYHVNLYQDATVTLDGVRFVIRGDYPAHDRVTVTVSAAHKLPAVKFRKPSWCPKMAVREGVKGHDGEGAVATLAYTLAFDMNPRLAERTLAADADATAEDAAATREDAAKRYVFVSDTDLASTLPKEPYATVLYGPLVLARTARMGAGKGEIVGNGTVNGKGYSVKLTPIEAKNVYAPFDVELAKPGASTIRARACAYESASDAPSAKNGCLFSIRF